MGYDDGFISDPAYQIAGFRDAGGLSTIGHRNRAREGRCTANGNTCKGFRTKGSDLCVGHQRAAKKAAQEAQEAPE